MTLWHAWLYHLIFNIALELLHQEFLGKILLDSLLFLQLAIVVVFGGCDSEVGVGMHWVWFASTGELLVK